MHSIVQVCTVPERVDVVDKFVFPGSTMHKDGEGDLEVTRRLSLVRAATNEVSTIMKSRDNDVT